MTSAQRFAIDLMCWRCVKENRDSAAISPDPGVWKIASIFHLLTLRPNSDFTQTPSQSAVDIGTIRQGDLHTKRLQQRGKSIYSHCLSPENKATEADKFQTNVIPFQEAGRRPLLCDVSPFVAYIGQITVVVLNVKLDTKLVTNTRGPFIRCYKRLQKTIRMNRNKQHETYHRYTNNDQQLMTKWTQIMTGKVPNAEKK